MGLVVGALFLLHVSIILSIPVGAIVYFLLLYVMREPLLYEIRDVVNPTV